jgi:phosphoglucosamine mutase
LFGTDGIRGRAGEAPLDPATVARIGAALVRAHRTDQMRADQPVRVLVGRDTRESGRWIERELARGIASESATTTSVGVMPTPAIAYLTRAERFDLGVVISASHNPFEDNGIKVFSGAGEKLTGEFETHVEQIVGDRTWDVPAETAPMITSSDLAGAYEAHLMRILATAGPLAGSRIVIDCANGATAAMAPALFARLGWILFAMGCPLPAYCNWHVSGIRAM